MQLSLITYYQIAGVALAVATMTLDTRENVLARPFSLLGTAVSLLVYYPAGLYAKCLQSTVNMYLDVYGWYQWLHRRRQNKPLQISKVKPLALVRMMVVSILATIVLGSLLHHYSSADLPYWDSLHTVLALVAHWLLVRKKLECWLVWIVADVLYAIVVYYKGLYFFSGLYVFYTLMAINGYRTWRRSYLDKTMVSDEIPGHDLDQS